MRVTMVLFLGGMLAMGYLIAAIFAIIEDDTWYYGLRLLAFVIILWAIVDKNRADR
jgi:hypothetical protein